ncbi:MAG: 1-deoxy-D-xylulose-5-phosphate reductoisomerase, partial [Bacteroidia bacterium]|nr:1-deoxy-D-xylulose-5-phosphate reductoisomerase [Bacteroidia bacterium]MDW8334832.1 1-deoxy-D-xylulose-5-phosphate reductoisomerase [Bacteroidia bacterium]
ESVENVRRLILTASGGPFRGKKRDDLRRVSPRDALKHPNWTMGAKITVDSATLMNKALEIIEAQRLFGLPAEKIEVVVHPQSIVHSAVEFCDGSVKAQIGAPDMRLPIAYALAYPSRSEHAFARYDFFASGPLTFEPPDRETFPSLDFAYHALEREGNLPCALNAANEEAVAMFLQERITFLEIFDVVAEAMQRTDFIARPEYEDLLATDAQARALARERASRRTAIPLS